MTLLRISSALALLSCLVPALAHAEAGAPPAECRVNVLPRVGAKVPASLPAFVALPTGGLTSTLGTPTFTGGAAPGFVVARDTRSAALLVVPDGALPSGSGELTIPIACSNGQNLTASAAFEITAPSSLPTSIGSAVALPPEAGRAYSKVVVTPSAELRPFVSTTLLDAKIAGRSGIWGTIGYGNLALTSAGTLEIVVPARAGFASAAGSPICEEAARGDRTVGLTFEAHVAGATSDPAPLSVDVTVNCDPTGPSGPGSDGGADGSTPGDASSGASADASTDEATVGGGGCSAAPASADLAAPFLLALTAAAIVARSTRRRTMG